MFQDADDATEVLKTTSINSYGSNALPFGVVQAAKRARMHYLLQITTFNLRIRIGRPEQIV